MASGYPPIVDISHVGDFAMNHGNPKFNLAALLQDEDFYKKQAIQNPCKTDGTSAIQNIIQNLQNDISNIQKFSNRFSTISGAVSVFINEDSGIGKDIKTIVDFATTDIASNIKTMLGPLRAWVLTEISKNVKKTLPFLFPSEVPSFVAAWRQGNDLILCAFAKILGLLFDIIGKLLLDFVDKFINGPLCAIEDFISNLFDNILSPIIDAINSALSLITGAIGNLASSLFNALGFINELINFFKCETKPECPSVDLINLSGTAFNTQSLNLSSSLPTQFGFGNTGIGTLPIPGCPTNPIPCGPPEVQFFGGGGFGVLANPIISPNSSSIIAFDIVNSGTGFLTAPTATLVDSCGKGSGSSLLVIMDPSGAGAGSTNLQVKNIVILAPGNGYLSSPDGSLGGNGNVWKDVDEGYVIKENGSLYVVPDGNEPPNLSSGDTFIPPQSQPKSNTLNYPVVLEIDEIYIDDGGFGYQNGDTLSVSPNNGAQLEPIINERGEIERVVVMNSGIGFIDIPEIFVNSKKGYNAKLIPVLKSIRLSDIDNTTIPPGTQIISVVDCVGKISSKH